MPQNEFDYETWQDQWNQRFEIMEREQRNFAYYGAANKELLQKLGTLVDTLTAKVDNLAGGLLSNVLVPIEQLKDIAAKHQNYLAETQKVVKGYDDKLHAIVEIAQGIQASLPEKMQAQNIAQANNLLPSQPTGERMCRCGH